MHIALFTFSGTGNTALTASMLADAFGSLGVSAEACQIEKLEDQGDLPDLSHVDAVGIGYPVYAFNAPKLVDDFAKLLPEADGKPVFIYKTAGEPFYWNASSSACLVRRLRARGYRVVFERHFLMPYNIMFRYPDVLAKQMVLVTGDLCRDMARRVLAGEAAPPRLTLPSRVLALLLRIQRPGAALNGRLCGANKNCTACGKCARECPVGNISLQRRKVRFGWRCIMCMRCVMYCPKGAIRFGLIQPLAFSGAYEFDKLLKDETIGSDYVNGQTKGYFKLFAKYYRWAEETIDKPIKK